MEIIYLACPYSQGGPEVRLARFDAVTHVAAKLIEQRHIIFSPITMTHPIDLVLADDQQTLGSDYWVEFDTQFMSMCSSLYVLTLPGWDISSGVKREISYFQERNIAAQYIDPKNFGVIAEIEKFRPAFVCG